MKETDAMRETIVRKLREIEEREHIRILYAAESGSRAWGFASPDSDYDVRFIYVREPSFYLRLDKTRDVIEMPINDALDINGWDLNKTLQLLHKSNPTLFEWLSSPVVYRQTELTDRFAPLLRSYFAPRTSMYHYLGTAKSTYLTHMRGKDEVRAKRYFYVLRPLFACRWIMERGTPPPVPFAPLREAYCEESIRGDVARLLDIKIHSPEIQTIPPIPAVDEYILRTAAAVEDYLNAMPSEPPKPWDALNEFFLSELNM